MSENQSNVVNKIERLRDRVSRSGLEEYTYVFVVAFCSFVYEMVYSEILTVLFGGGATRYATTIGLYMFSLGIGSFMTGGLSSKPNNFQRLETYIAFAPLGFIFIIGLQLLPLDSGFLLILSHIPVLLVGFLSGMEIPLVSGMMNDKDTSEKILITKIFRDIGTKTVNLIYAFIGIFFTTRKTDSKTDSFSEILGVDYLGSLVGAVGYALVLYPDLGLIPTVFFLGLLNALVGIAIALRYSDTSRTLLVIALVLTTLYGGAIVNSEQTESKLTQLYTESQIKGEYINPENVSIDVNEHMNTKYQSVTWYNRSIVNYKGETQKDTCLSLDTAVQMCDNWVRSYHNGLVDVPMTMYSETEYSDMEVLIIGGGDWIPINYLKDYGVTIDHVDIDSEFYNYTKNNDKLEKYHDNAYEYKNLNTYSQDAMRYLDENEKKYDLVLLDVPGIKNTDSLPLYSEELYSSINRNLDENGMVVSWIYQPNAYPNHHDAYMKTVKDSGFNRQLTYDAYEDVNNDGDVEETEKFVILSSGEVNRNIKVSQHKYTKQHKNMYNQLEWYDIQDRDVRSNSVFHPNYDIIVNNGD
jgi:spermidine synthase